MATPAVHQLHLVTEPPHRGRDFVTSIALALDGGVDWVQLRDKSASASALLAMARQLRGVVRQHGARLAVNDRLDVALAARGDGVHLAAQSLPVSDAVALADGRLLVGRSVHSLEEAVQAAQAGADYVTFGHVFPTTTHPGVPPRGLSELEQIVNAVEVPVLAIGGITAQNIDEVLATGCAGVAVISAILSASDPSAAAQTLRQAIDTSKHQPRIPWRQDAAHHQPATV